MRAVIYRRVSKDEQKLGFSLESQQEDCLRNAEQNGHSIVADFEEVHSGDYLDERDALWEVRQLMRRKAFDVLLVWKIDRLSRNTDHQSVILYEARKYGVSVESVMEKIDETPAGRLERQIRGMFADMERQGIRERTIRGKLKRAEQGLAAGAFAPLGYHYADGEKTTYDIDPTRQALTAHIWQLLLSGWGLKETARFLTNTGVPTPRSGREWSSQMIRGMIDNPIYYGRPATWRTTHRYTQEVDGITARTRTKNTVVLRLPEEHIALAPCPAYVTEEQARWVQSNIAARRTGQGGRSVNPQNYLLRRGYLRCGYCGGTLSCREKGEQRYPAYACVNGCYFSVHAYKVDGFAWEQVKETLQNPQPLLDALHQFIAEHATPASRSIEAWADELRDLEEQVGNLIDNLTQVSGKAGEVLRTRLVTVSARSAHLKVEIAKAQTSQMSWERVMESVHILLDACRDLGELESFTYAQKRLALYLLGVRVTAWRKNHVPRWETSIQPFAERCCVDKNTTIVFPLQPFYEFLDRLDVTLGAIPKVKQDTDVSKVTENGSTPAN
jgi:site-specific DNA recombinase